MAIDWKAVATRLKYEDETAMWEKLYTEKGLGIVELSERFGVGKATVRDALARNGVPLRKRGGANNRRAELSDVQLDAIERLGLKATAKALGISSSALYKQYVRRRGLRRAVKAAALAALVAEEEAKKKEEEA